MVLMLPVVIIRLLAIATVVIGFYTLLKIYDYSPYKPSWYFFLCVCPRLMLLGLIVAVGWRLFVRAEDSILPTYSDGRLISLLVGKLPPFLPPAFSPRAPSRFIPFFSWLTTRSFLLACGVYWVKRTSLADPGYTYGDYQKGGA